MIVITVYYLDLDKARDSGQEDLRIRVEIEYIFDEILYTNGMQEYFGIKVGSTYNAAYSDWLVLGFFRHPIFNKIVVYIQSVESSKFTWEHPEYVLSDD